MKYTFLYLILYADIFLLIAFVAYLVHSFDNENRPWPQAVFLIAMGLTMLTWGIIAFWAAGILYLNWTIW